MSVNVKGEADLRIINVHKWFPLKENLSESNSIGVFHWYDLESVKV